MTSTSGSTPTGTVRGTRGDLRRTVKTMYDESRTGVLEVTGDEGTVQIHVKDGKVVHAVPPPGSDWLLGHVLVESGTVPEKKLYRLRRKHRKTGRSLEVLLIEQGSLTHDVLSKYLDLQLRETIVPLFLQDEVHAEFRDEPPLVNDFVRPVPIPFLLKEAEKRKKEWPVLQRLGIRQVAVFDKTDESIAQFLGGGEGRLESATAEGQLGASERLVYYYVNGRKTVQQVAFASCLGDFETIRALNQLKRRGFIYLVEREGKGEQHEDPTMLPKLIAMTFYLFLSVLVAGIVLLEPPLVRQLLTTVSGQEDVRSAYIRDAYSARIRKAVDLHFTRYGEYPTVLFELGAREILPGDELAYNIEGLVYEPHEEGYTLRKRGGTAPSP